jgi:hypothetical protein
MLTAQPKVTMATAMRVSAHALFLGVLIQLAGRSANNILFL